MSENERSANPRELAPEQPNLDRYALVESEDGAVIRDQRNPAAWIKSDLTRDIEA